MKNIMVLQVESMTGAQLETLRLQQYTARHTFDYIPKYVLTDKGNIRISEEWLQFGGQDDVTYYLFNILHIENPLDLEIHEVGIEDVLKDIDLSVIRTLPNINKFEHRLSPPNTDYLLFDVTYEGGYEPHTGEWDYECFVELDGFLSADKRMVTQLEAKELSEEDQSDLDIYKKLGIANFLE